MKMFVASYALVAALFLAFAPTAQAAPPGGFGPLPIPAQACLGPAALHNPHCASVAGGGGGSGAAGGGSGSGSGAKSGGGSHHNLLAKVGIVAIAAVTLFIIYCLANENDDGTNDSKYCERQPEPADEFEYELVQNSTNLYARKW